MHPEYRKGRILSLVDFEASDSFPAIPLGLGKSGSTVQTRFPRHSELEAQALRYRAEPGCGSEIHWL
ncbi:hypothetical protein RSAG8_03747, partial [Rhizoctonia solani AG-8 WAC10335]